MSRFILDLQEVNLSRSRQMTSSSESQSSIEFTGTRIIGSLGSTLPPPGDADHEWENKSTFDSNESSEELGNQSEAHMLRSP